MSERVRILLADDHVIVAAGIRALLQADFEIIETVDSGSALVRAAERLRPDVIVADIAMPGISGIEAIRQIAKALPSTKSVVLSMHSNPVFVEEALGAGASAYVLKTDAPHTLVSAIRAVLCGTICTSPGLSRRAGKSPACSESLPLTTRQRQVLELVCRGYSMKQIAWNLRITQKTVEFHKYGLMRQLSVDTTAELVAKAVRTGLIER